MGLQNAATKRRRIGRIRKFHLEKVPEQNKARRNSNKNLTKMREGRKKDNPIRGKMMQLDSIKLKKFKKEVRWGKTEPRPHEMHEKNRLIRGWGRNLVTT